ncbi:hypothetical protein ACFWMG_04960 [Streptomyces sp. NPDC127074]|uniref:hypothetical protein n=1 Tax=Streptomyces sp. NPDC127074 TaxID=3347130 RepID=UPI0036552BA9
MANYPIPDQPKGSGQVAYADVQQHPHYYLATSGPGREAAEQSECEHGYALTASCPNCP